MPVESQTMRVGDTTIEDTFAEAFRMWAARLIVTAADDYWVDVASREATGYGTSVIGCDAEAGVERRLSPDDTPDMRPGAALLFFAFNAKTLAKALPNRVGQCLMTCPTSAVYDGMVDGFTKQNPDDTARIDVGKSIRFFGDGFQKSKVVMIDDRQRRLWRIAVMDGEFVVEDDVGAIKAIGGGNFLIGATSQRAGLMAARRAVDAIATLHDVITPFPGGVVRSGSKVGSRYKTMFASTNDAFCPTLRDQTDTQLHDDVNCVYEIVINGLSEIAIAGAMRTGIEAAAGQGVVDISAGNYGGKLGKFHFQLHKVMAPAKSETA
jgi:formylmethanofuran--tetrahydromethanopterin N-formyltransferase